MAKPIFKVAVRCPHCGGEQPEPELAKSTFCRSCSQYFAITPAVFASPKRASAPKREVTPVASPAIRKLAPTLPSSPGGTVPPGGGLIDRIESLFGKPKTRVARCFECTSGQEVVGNASSTTCRACGAYIDLQDYKINSSFSRNIQTRGSIYLGSKGDLSSSKVRCNDAIIHGKMRGNMHCDGKVTIRYQGRLQGTLETGALTIEKGSEVVFSRAVRVACATIAGKVVGQIFSASQVTIHKTGSLEGGVVATGFSVERGGSFQGEMTISPPGTPSPDVGQAELELKLAGAKKSTAALDAFLAGEQSPAMG